MSQLVILFIRFYQRGLSPFLEPRCRFTPSCSIYFQEAVARFGAPKGLLRGMLRFLRCHPFCAGGYDPVDPEA